MPYNTRRKSLSLPSLGIQLPQSSRALAANRAAAATASSTLKGDHPPSKRVKRSHSSPSPPSPPSASASASVARGGNSNAQHHGPSLASRHVRRPYEHTPPPSPRSSCEPRIDPDSIGDEIVVGVIQQLEKTGNKPQLVKELAAVLCNSLDSVESSANPQAIISSRLNAYLKRPWTTLAPCPLAKTLIPTHPRRIYFYLTNQPHQPLPAFSSESPLPSSRRALISPSLSSDDDHETRKRAALSPSPEVDLSAAQLQAEDDESRDKDAGDDVFFDAAPIVGPPTPAGSFGGRSSLGRDGSNSEAEAMSQRAVSPPLERDEREFTRTASAMQSKRSLSVDRRRLTLDDADPTTVHASIEAEASQITAGGVPTEMDVDGKLPTVAGSDGHPEGQQSEAAAALFLFGQEEPTSTASPLSLSTIKPPTSPMPTKGATGLHITTTMTAVKGETHFGQGDGFTMMDLQPADDPSRPVISTMPDMGWAGEVRSPEHVELQELEDLLGGF